jgi:hypothetical protein
MLVSLAEGICEYAIEIASCGMICILSFMKSCTGIQAIFKFGRRNLRGCNVGITDGRDL